MTRSCIIVLSCLAATACATTTGEERSRFQSPARPEPLTSGTAADLRELSALSARYGLPPPIKAGDVFEKIAARPPTTTDRLDLATKLMAQSDTKCLQYLDSVSLSQRTWRSTFAVLGTAFGVAGGVATPARSKGLLSALAGGMGGIRGNLDEGILQNQTSYLIRSANVSLRARLRQSLIEDIKTGDLKEASLPTIVAVIEGRYHPHCGIDDGLAELGEAVKQRTQTPADAPPAPAKPKPPEPDTPPKTDAPQPAPPSTPPTNGG